MSVPSPLHHLRCTCKLDITHHTHIQASGRYRSTSTTGAEREFRRALSCGNRAASATLKRRSRQSGARWISCKASGDTSLVPFPSNYDAVTRQSQVALEAALNDGKKLIEIELPPLGLASVPGDSEGVNEMNESAVLIRRLCKMFDKSGQAEHVRIYFPDAKEMIVAKSCSEVDEPDGTFANAPYNLDFLTQPTALLELGIDFKAKFQERVKPTDEVFIAAYPSFNVNEIIAIEELHRTVAKASGVPIIVYNGEMDRIRSGYYPKFFYPKLGKLAESFLPQFETAYYIHNFKGTRPGVLFRAYPGPWQVLLRGKNDEMAVVHTQASMPSLKEVALEILPHSV